MKIGILTLPFNNNYGGYLQAYALMTSLKQQGHDVELIYRRHNKKKTTIAENLRYFIKQLTKSAVRLKLYPLLQIPETDYRRKGKNMLTFVDKYIVPKTQAIYSSDSLAKICSNQYDAVIVGSDQVWRAIYVPNVEDYYLRFISDERIVKISYAASFGSNRPEYTEKQIAECGKLLTLFNAVSVREDSGINVVESFGWIYPNLHVVLDPTLLLPREHYITLIQDVPKQKSCKSFLCYILDEKAELLEYINEFYKLLTMKPFHVIGPKSSDCVFPSIETWLQCFNDASFVVTDSYHGVVFCILFNTPFAVYVNQHRGGDRFISLLNKLGLCNRIISSLPDVERLVNDKICWEEVNEKLSKERKKSLDFLENALSAI